MPPSNSMNVVPLSGERIKDGKDPQNEWFWSRTDDFLEEIDLSKSHPALVEGLFPLCAGGVFNGGGGVGKSTSIAELFGKVAWWTPGTKWLGRDVNEHETGRIIMISGDEPLERIGRSMVSTGALDRRRAWQEKHRSRETQFKSFGIDDFNDKLFIANGDEVVPTDRFKRLMDVAEKWKPAMIAIDTVVATSALDFDRSNAHGAGYQQHLGQLAVISGACVTGIMHNAKHSQIRSIMDAANAACGASQLINSGRFAFSMYRAHKELAQAVVQAGLGGADRMKNVIVCGLSKSNIDDMEGLEPLVFVRQPRDGKMVVPMVEVTSEIRNLQGGNDLLEGIESISADRTGRRNAAKETKQERKAREESERKEDIERIDHIMNEQGISCPVEAAAWLDAQTGRKSPAKSKDDRWAAKRFEAQQRANDNADIRNIMKQHGVDAFDACKFYDTGKFAHQRRG